MKMEVTMVDEQFAPAANRTAHALSSLNLKVNIGTMLEREQLPADETVLTDWRANRTAIGAPLLRFPGDLTGEQYRSEADTATIIPELLTDLQSHVCCVCSCVS